MSTGFSPLSLNGAGAAGQEVLHVDRHRLGEVGHAPVASTGGAVVQQLADAGGRVSLQDGLVCSQVGLRRRRKKNVLKTYLNFGG